jgi:hypothetical protein
MASRYGEFLLIVVMLLMATVAVAVAMGTGAPEDAVGPRDGQYTVDAQLFVNDTANRTAVAYGNMTGLQRTEFDRARNGTLTMETRPQLLEYAGYPYLIERGSRHYEVVIYVYD